MSSCVMASPSSHQHSHVVDPMHFSVPALCPLVHTLTLSSCTALFLEDLCCGVMQSACFVSFCDEGSTLLKTLHPDQREFASNCASVIQLHAMFKARFMYDELDLVKVVV